MSDQTNCQFETGRVYNENCTHTLAKMPDNFIDLVVTSPPYDDLRRYKGYVFPFEDIAKLLYQKLKVGGVIIWIVGDQTLNGSESCTSFKQAIFFRSLGFRLHDTMIYAKDSPYPGNIRYRQGFEYMFVLSKGKPSVFNPIKDTRAKNPGGKIVHSQRAKDGSVTKRKVNAVTGQFKFRNNIWRYNVGFNGSSRDKIAFEHPAIFPEALVEDHIVSWSNENDLVYDPFMGSGTVAKMAHLLNRRWVGSEISAEYIDVINRRLAPYI